MVATTPTENNCPQKDYNDMASSIESGCVENVFFTVRNLYTGKRVLRQVKQEEITKVSFVLGQLATQVIEEKYIKLFCITLYILNKLEYICCLSNAKIFSKCF